MSAAAGKGMLIEARRELLAQWARTGDVWDDGNARKFEERYITPVDRLVRQATEAMDELTRVVEQARRACE